MSEEDLDIIIENSLQYDIAILSTLFCFLFKAIEH